jgi:hypothetical protein
MMDCEGHRVALTKRNHLGARLHTRPLLGEHEFAPGKISLRLREQDRHLYGKDVFTVEILMQAVEVPLPILEEQRRRPLLSRVVTTLYELLMSLRVANIDPHSGIPTIRDGSKPRIERGAKTLDQFRQRIVKVLVLSASESVPCHDDTTAEDGFPRIQSGERLALNGRENSGKQTTSLLSQLRGDPRPIESVDSGNRILRGCGIDPISVASSYLTIEKNAHGCTFLFSNPRLGRSLFKFIVMRRRRHSASCC